MSERHDERAARFAGATGPFDPGLRWLTVGLLLNVLCVAFEALAIATVMPAVVEDLGHRELYGWVFSAFLLANLVGIVVAGLHADAKGPGGPFAWGVALFAIGLLFGGMAPSMPLLIAARALQGFGGGALSSVAYVAIGRAYPEGAKPRMLALLSTGWVLPGLVGPYLAGVIAERTSWHWVFLALVPLPLIAAMMALPQLRAVPGGTPDPAARRRVAQAAALSLGAGLLLAGLSQPTLWLAAAMVAIGLVVGLRPLAALLPPGTLRGAPGLPAAIATMLLLNLALNGVDLFIPLALTDLHGYPADLAGLTLTAVSVMWTAGSWLQARLSPSGARRRLVQGGLVLTTIGAAGVTVIANPQWPAIIGQASWGLGGLGIGLAFSTASLIVLETAPPGQEGNASAALQLVNVLGAALGAGIGGAFVASLGGVTGSLQVALTAHDLTMVGVLLLAIVIAGRLPMRQTTRGEVGAAEDAPLAGVTP
ncbi:MAG: MFS transporter [Thermomicrobiales bacterium]|nr:MFS transporter [Thermomicrobiales bacterium]